jgi:hypothetical protein
VNVIVQDDWAVMAFVNRGTHTRPLEISQDTFALTGRKVKIRYCSVMRVAGESVDAINRGSIAFCRISPKLVRKATRVRRMANRLPESQLQ